MLKNLAKFFLAVLGVVGVGTAGATEGGFTLPTIDFAPVDAVTSAITEMSPVAKAVLGGFIIFLIVVKSMKWTRKIA